MKNTGSILHLNYQVVRREELLLQACLQWSRRYLFLMSLQQAWILRAEMKMCIRDSRKGKEAAIKNLVTVPLDENGSIPHDFICLLYTSRCV